jgi:outer membrane protein OmpA-like peptidoglycan-associated protein
MSQAHLAAKFRQWPWQRLRRPARWLAWTLLVLLVLALVSWLALPSYVKKIASAQTEEKIGRKLSIGEVSFNPFRLALTASDITLFEPDGKTPFFTAQSLLVNASSASLFRLAPVLDELRLSTPEVHVVRTDANGAGHYNFSDILDRIAALPKSEGETHFSLANVQLEGGHIRFDDKVTGKKIDISALQLGLPFISNLSGSIDSFVQPQLSANVDGTLFHLKGRSKPFVSSQESSFAIDVDQLDLVSYLPFVPADLPLKLASAKLSTKLDLSFNRADGKPKVALSGDIVLDDVSLQSREQAQLLKAQRLSARLNQFDVLNASGEISELRLDQPQVWAAMNARGQINWLTALAPASRPAAAAAPSSAPATDTVATKTDAATPERAVVVRQLLVQEGEVNWRDEANAKPAQDIKLGKININATQLSTAANAEPATLKLSAIENGQGSLGFEGKLSPLAGALDGRATLTGIELAGYQAYLNGVLAAKASGKLSGAAGVQLAQGALKVSDLGLTLDQLKLQPTDKGNQTITVKSIALQKASLDLAAHRADAEAVRITGLAGNIRREDDGNFNLQRLQVASDSTAPAAATTPAPTSAAADRHGSKRTVAPQWQARLGSFSIADSKIDFADASAGSKSQLQIHDINLQVQNLSSQLDAPSKISFQAQFDKAGKLSVTGQVAAALKTIDLDIDARNLPVAPFQGYFSNVLNVTLNSGLLSAHGKLALTPPVNQQRFALSYNGNASIGNLRMQDKLTTTDFLRWRSLELSGIQARLGERTQILLDQISLSNFYARAILSDKGRLNLQDVLVSDASAQGSITDAGKSGDKGSDKSTRSARNTTTSTAPVTGAASADAPLIRVGQVKLAGGNINYTDNFVNPNYTANMTGLAGTIGAISSDKPQPAPVNISGKIDDDAPLQISGTLNPLFKPMFLDIKASANGVQLPRLTPYSAKYAGYAITKGKLSMDVQYKIENDKLVAENDVRIEQLTFGDRIDSPEATKLPVMLAVSLLKDREGNINLNLPISGSLSDPEFSVGGIIMRVFVNLIVKAVTSPFALIGSMFNSSEGIGELHYIEFAPGSSEITADVRKKLDALGYVLNERPGIKLDITGRVDPKVDDPGLREEALNRQMRGFKRRDVIEEEGQPSGPVQISAAERTQYLERVYKEGKFKKPRNMVGLTKSLPADEMHKLIIDNTEVTPDDLRNLAQRRADQIRGYLQEQSIIAPARIFLIAPKLNADGIPAKEPTSRVDLNIQ